MAAFYSPKVIVTLCGAQWGVETNGHTVVEKCSSQKEAQLRAAALNYAAMDHLPRGVLIGLDGLSGE